MNSNDTASVLAKLSLVARSGKANPRNMTKSDTSGPESVVNNILDNSSFNDQSPQAAIAKNSQEPPKNALDELFMRKDAIHSANAAKSLTQLFAAIIEHPGTGKETPTEEYTSALDQLLIKTHSSVNDIIDAWAALTNSNESAAFRQMLTQTVAFHMAHNWQKNTSNTADKAVKLIQLVRSYVKKDGPALKSFTASYIEIDNEDLLEAHKLNALTKSSLNLLSIVQDYSWSYEREPIEVASDLSQIAYKLAAENELLVTDIGLRSNWFVNCCDRATKIIGAHYKTFTESALLGAKADEMLSEVSLAQKAKLYDKILHNIESRSYKDYTTIERNALKVMGKNGHKLFLPKLSDDLGTQEIKNAAQRQK